MKTKFVRVKDPSSGHEFTIAQHVLDGLDKGALEVLDEKDAVDMQGNPLAAKPKIKLPRAGSAAREEFEPPADVFFGGHVFDPTIEPTEGNGLAGDGGEDGDASTDDQSGSDADNEGNQS